MRRGVRVTLCTGRMYSGTRKIAESLKLFDPVACIDGSHIVDVKTHRELASSPLPDPGVKSLFEILGREHVAYAFSGDCVYYDGRGGPYLSYLATWSDQTVKIESVLNVEQWQGGQGISALVAISTEEHIGQACSALAAHSETLQSAAFPLHRYEGTWAMVVRAARVDNGTAVEWLARHHGVTPEQVVTVGDWWNDVPMLRRAGRSFAMGQAPDEVKAAATDVLESDAWSGGGIAEAAERAGLL